MEIRQLEYFVAVAEEASFTRAAERVHISQSGVSAQIQLLEKELGARLFDRAARAAVLTGAGSAALVEARTVLSALAAVRQAVDDVNGVVRGRLRVGMVTACAVTPLFEALAAFHQAHPGVELALSEDNSDVLIDRVRSGSLELALVGTAGSAPAGLSSFTIVSEGLVALAPTRHPLAAADKATLAEVAAHSIVSLPAGTGVRAVFDQCCAAAGLQPDIALQASAPDTVVDLASRGLGVAILSETMAAGYATHAGLTSVAIVGVDIPAVLSLVWGAAPSPALRQLLDRARRAFSSDRD